MIRKDSIVPASRVNRKELILSTILKVYAIRADVEERAEENRLRNIPLLGGLAMRLASPALSKSQYKDAAAFVTATCTSNEALVLMEHARTSIQPSVHPVHYDACLCPGQPFAGVRDDLRFRAVRENPLRNHTVGYLVHVTT